MKKEFIFEKKYRLWVENGFSNTYSHTEYDTLEECAENIPTDDRWLITQKVDYTVETIIKEK